MFFTDDGVPSNSKSPPTDGRNELNTCAPIPMDVLGTDIALKIVFVIHMLNSILFTAF